MLAPNFHHSLLVLFNIYKYVFSTFDTHFKPSSCTLTFTSSILYDLRIFVHSFFDMYLKKLNNLYNVLFNNRSFRTILIIPISFQDFCVSLKKVHLSQMNYIEIKSLSLNEQQMYREIKK